MQTNKKIYRHDTQIKSWKQFGRKVRSQGNDLLVNLELFPNSILVTGCQRSGTTILSRIITNSEGMVNYWFGQDDELDAALILSGFVDQQKVGRYCFQTTYLNERYHEYFNYNNYKMIWVLRNPFSVVYSLMYNWKNFALNELFIGCGIQLLDDEKKNRYNKFGIWGINKLTKACLSYNGKLSQAFELNETLGKDKILFIDYDKLVEEKETILPAIYQFINLSYKQEYCNKINNKSIKKNKNLSSKEYEIIQSLCLPIYNKGRILLVD